MSGTCAAGNSIRVVAADGTVTCEPDTDTTYTAGNQLSLTGTRFDVQEGSGSGLDADLLDGQNGAYYNDWDNLADIPAGFADGVDNDTNTTYSAGDGLDLAATTFSVDVTDIRGTGLSETSNDLEVATTYRLPQACTNGQIAEWNGTTWQCGDDDTGGGAHDHWGESWSGSGTGLTLMGGTMGLAGNGSSYGVYGSTVGGRGVYGASTSGYGVYGYSALGYGVYSDGDFHATGNVSCDGTKSSVANTEHSGERLLYAIESPEVWFEDFGTASLADGSIPGEATVTIDPIFAQTVNLNEDYHIFVTPLSDEPVLLFITDKGDASFTVRGVTLDGDPAECDFDWRLTAKRLGYEDTRLEPIPDKLIEAQEMVQEEQHSVSETFLETPGVPIAGVTQ